MPWMLGAGYVGASIAGGLLGNSAQSSANATNVKLQREQRDWQERMANSAYQRAVTDMKAAGLNPMLAYGQGGADTPSVSAATVGPVDALSKQVTSAGERAAQGVALAKMKAEAESAGYKARQDKVVTEDLEARYSPNMGSDSQTNITIALQQALRTTAQNQRDQSFIGTDEAHGRLDRQAIDNRIRQIEQQIAEGTLDINIQSAEARANLLKQELTMNEARQILLKLQIPEAKVMAEWFERIGEAGPAAKAVMDIGSWIKYMSGGK